MPASRLTHDLHSGEPWSGTRWGQEDDMASKELIKGIASALVGPALWFAVLLLASKAQGGW